MKRFIILIAALALASCVKLDDSTLNPDVDKLKVRFNLQELQLGDRITYGCPDDGDYYQAGYRVAMRNAEGRVLTGMICKRDSRPSWRLYIDGDSLLLNAPPH